MAAASSHVRQNYHADCEAAINVQAQLQQYASYVYLSMATYCERADVAQSSLSRCFLRRSHRWGELATKLLWMQAGRGGSVVLRDIAQPHSNDWNGGPQALECAFHLENTLHESLLELHRLAAGKGDPHLCDFLQRHYLRPQVRVLHELREHLTHLRVLEPEMEDAASHLLNGLRLDDHGPQD